MTLPKYQVFISSTREDLSEAREAVTWELLKLAFIPVGMEAFSAQQDRGWKVIQRTIDESDYYVLLIAGRYGSIDPETGVSWTQREYAYARERGVPVHAFIRDMGHVPGDQVDKDEKWTKLEAFKNVVAGAHLREEWTTIDDLRARVGAALSKTVQSDTAEGTARPGWYRGPAPDLIEFSLLSSEVRELREQLAARPHNPALAIVKALPRGIRLYVSGTRAGSKFGGEFFFRGIDEQRNIVVVDTGAGPSTTFPLDKLDTAFATSTDGSQYRLGFAAFG